MNRKRYVASAIVILLAIAVAVPALALIVVKPVKGTLNLYQKDTTNWMPIHHKGVLKYYEFGTSERGFWFTGWDLEPKTDYSLIAYHPDVWDPTLDRPILAEGISHTDGRLWLRGIIPDELVFRGTDVNPEVEFIKIWLVLSADLDGTRLVNFDHEGDDWLFECSLITFY